MTPSSAPPPPKMALGKRDQAKINLSAAKISLAAEAMEGLPVGASLPSTKKEQAALASFGSELTDLRDSMPKLMSRASGAQAVAVKAQDMASTAKAEVAAAKAEAAAAAEEAAAAKAEAAAAKEEAAAAQAEAMSALEQAKAAKVEAESAREEAAAAKEQAAAAAGALEQQKEQADAEMNSMREALDKAAKKQEELIAKLTARMDAAEQKLTVPVLPSGRASPMPMRKVSSTAASEAESKSEQLSEQEPNLLDKFFSIFNKKEEEAAPVEEVIEPACYLLFSAASGGVFLTHWSEVPVPGALACFVPEKPVPKFKYESNGGRSELKRGVGGPNKKLFYAGWVSFVRSAFSHSGKFTFLANVQASPVALYVNMKADTTVVRLEVGAPLKLTSAIAAVAVAPALATNLNVQTMTTRMFISVGEKQGAAFSLDGGQDGFDEKVSTPRRSSVDE